MATPPASPRLRAEPCASKPIDWAWSFVLALAERAQRGAAVCAPAGFVLRGGVWRETCGEPAEVWVDAGSPVRFSLSFPVPEQAELSSLFELFMPLVLGKAAETLVVGHLGQSLDGRVATPTGASRFITGHEDVRHTHRLRALCDAVLVGVRTVQLDDPQLTTRLVAGKHPCRVVLDPHGKLRDGFKLLEDGAAETVIVSAQPSNLSRRPHVTCLTVPCRDGRFDLPVLLSTLRERGLSRIFVEGGGVTVSRFLSEQLLDRLHVGVAPLILGSGAPAFALPLIDKLEEAIRLRCRHFSLGGDMLFDCEPTRRAPVDS